MGWLFIWPATTPFLLEHCLRWDIRHLGLVLLCDAIVHATHAGMWLETRYAHFGVLGLYRRRRHSYHGRVDWADGLCALSVLWPVRGRVDQLARSTDPLFGARSIQVLLKSTFSDLSKFWLRDNPGAASLFVVGAYGGTLSTVSSGINSMATVLISDFIRPFESHITWFKPSDRNYTILVKVNFVI